MTLEQELDNSIRRQLAQVMKSDAPKGVKAQLLEKLELGVMQYHPDGLNAAVLVEISDAQSEVLLSDGGEPQR